MRRLGLLAVVLIAAATLTACGADDDASLSASGLPARQVDSGAVEVKITPTGIDETGATFEVVLDTHSVELAVDIAAATTLEVDGTAWAVDGWVGSRPGGHHRQGTLRFTADGPASGTARLTITGLPEPVEATWDLDGS